MWDSSSSNISKLFWLTKPKNSQKFLPWEATLLATDLDLMVDHQTATGQQISSIITIPTSFTTPIPRILIRESAESRRPRKERQCEARSSFFMHAQANRCAPFAVMFYQFSGPTVAQFLIRIAAAVRRKLRRAAGTSGLSVGSRRRCQRLGSVWGCVRWVKGDEASIKGLELLKLQTD